MQAHGHIGRLPHTLHKLRLAAGISGPSNYNNTTTPPAELASFETHYHSNAVDPHVSNATLLSPERGLNHYHPYHLDQSMEQPPVQQRQSPSLPSPSVSAVDPHHSHSTPLASWLTNSRLWMSNAVEQQNIRQGETSPVNIPNKSQTLDTQNTGFSFLFPSIQII
ncbi:unnamed protein product [Protopolystoma xenopodis]|uniref:Uncharacterized protein n=1 Tax=Protopolystoma xenopodis TaxID=117903 RepID=A0A3S5CKB9_9PLAT|nr:unnamed protein product [Protopolystoma xenopodis]